MWRDRIVDLPLGVHQQGVVARPRVRAGELVDEHAKDATPNSDICQCHYSRVGLSFWLTLVGGPVFTGHIEQSFE
jgi:hypothetical protein